MFANLNTTQFVAMILGIVFSGIAVATSFFAMRWAKRYTNKVVACVATMLAPFLAIASWFFLIFSYVKGVKEDEVFNIFLSLAISLVVCFMILIVSALLLRKNKDRLLALDQQEAEQEALEKQEEVAKEAEETEKVEEEAKEGEVDDQTAETLALGYEKGEDVVEGETAAEENEETTENVEEETTEENVTEDVAQSEENEQTDEDVEETEELEEEEELTEETEEEEVAEEVEPTPVEEDDKTTSDDDE